MNVKQLPQDENCVVDMTFVEAKHVIQGRHGSDLLKALIAFEEEFDEYYYSDCDQDQFQHDFCYEISAFNKICRDMGPLFA